MYLNDLQGVNCCVAAVEAMAFLLHSKQKQQSAGDGGYDGSWVFSPRSVGISEQWPWEEALPRTQHTCECVQVSDARGSRRSASVAVHFTNKDNHCSEGFVFCLEPKRKILKKKAVIGKA